MRATGWAVLGLAALATLAIPAEPALAACPAGTVQVGERREPIGNIIYVHPVCRRVRPLSRPSLPPCGALPASIDAIRREADGLRRELRQNTRQAAQMASALDEWVALAQDARAKARRKAFAQAFDLAVARTVRGLQRTASLHRQLNVQEAGLLRREWAAIVSRLSQMSPSERAYHLGRIGNATTAEQGLKALNIGMAAIDSVYKTGEAVIEPGQTEYWEAGAAGLQLVEKLGYANPYTSLLIADLRAIENATYGWWAVLAARGQLQSLIALEDSLLEESIRESSRYVLLKNAIFADSRGEAYCNAGAG